MKYLCVLASLIFMGALRAQINNPSFEEWDTINGVINPRGWITNNDSLLTYAQQDTNSEDGDFAVYLSNEPNFFEYPAGELQTFFKTTLLDDTLYVRLKRPINHGPQSYVVVSISPIGYSPTQYNYYLLEDTAFANYQTWVLPFSFEQMPDSVRLDIFAGCSSMIPTKGVFIDQISFNSINLGEDEIRILNPLKVFPNPATQEIVLKGAAFSIETLKCSDISGRSFLLPNEGDGHYDVSHLPKGVYLIQVEQGLESSVTKFIKM